MNLWDILITAFIAAVIILAVVIILRNRKQGKGCCGDCAKCGGCIYGQKDKQYDENNN